MYVAPDLRADQLLRDAPRLGQAIITKLIISITTIIATMTTTIITTIITTITTTIIITITDAR